ncbi:pyrroline-5-carboxylate reductase [Enemella dayhoffiae]|uniref:Pyrroline-5-carboxylate reductase n=1 Tax=Enemella dayhoffiae TaxID=2016507 RepID=A0A255H6J1_9ACTN|nr:pyrroline-5-carboxylate reductase [Enemella dayhoffiae]OYO22783.1 pyrroline-5-carboxylate reductase [Enemella dayhoffiae]
MTRVALLGGGVMGEAVLSGLLASGHAADDLVVAEKRAERAAELTVRHGVATASGPEAVRGADVVLVVVKPADVAGVLGEVAGQLAEGALVVSLCAGVSTAAVEDVLPAGTPVVRVMPNTPARIGQGMAAASAGRHASAEQVARVVELLAGTGRVVEVPEKLQDAVTAVSGSGPAYLFLVAEAMTDAAVTLGLPRDTARELVTQTLLGSATLLAENGEHPTLLREQVTSPGGTTAAALAVLEQHGLRAAFGDALTAARDRSVELGG